MVFRVKFLWFFTRNIFFKKVETLFGLTFPKHSFPTQIVFFDGFV